MPLDQLKTRADYSKQLKQFPNTIATFSGETNILQKFSIKSIELDTEGSFVGSVLAFNGSKYEPVVINGFGDTILNGLNLTYVSGLTYNVSSGSFRIIDVVYFYAGGDIDISSGNTLYSRFDLVYITDDNQPYIREGTPAINPVVPSLLTGEVQIGIISVPALFTGGTGSTVIQITADTVFEYNNSSTGIQRTGAFNSLAIGEYSFAPSRDSRAFEADSNAFGLGVWTSGISQTVVGKYNQPIVDAFFVVGIGIDSSNKKNSFYIDTTGNTNILERLFIKNIEIQPTGATNNQILRFNNGVFEPSNETVTGITSLSTGISLNSGITNNNILIKSLSAGTNINIDESEGLLVISSNINIEDLTGITDINTVGSGQSLISGKTGTTYFLYSISGAGGTTISRVGNLIVISSSTSGTTPSAINIGGFVPIYTNPGSQFQYRTLLGLGDTFVGLGSPNNYIVISSRTDTVTGVTTVGGGISFLSGSVINRNVISKTYSAGTKISISDVNGLITLSSPDEVTNGRARALAIYRNSSPILFSSFTASSISEIVVQLGTHTATTGRTYTIPNVNNDADFVMTQGNQTIFGKKDYFSGYTLGPSGNTSVNTFTNNIFNFNYLNQFLPITTYGNNQDINGGVTFLTGQQRLRKIYNIFPDEDIQITGGTTIGLYEEYQLKRNNGATLFNTNVVISGVTIAKATHFKSTIGVEKLIGNANFISNAIITGVTDIVNQYYEFNGVGAQNSGDWAGHQIKSYRGISLGGYASTPAARRVNITEHYDIYVGRFLRPNTTNFVPLLVNRGAGIYIERKNKNGEQSYDVLNRNPSTDISVLYTNTPWSIFVEGDRGYIGATLALQSGLTLTSTTRGAWIDLGSSQNNRPHINFISGSNISSPQDGDLWYNGTNLNFRRGGSTIDLLLTGSTSGGISTGSTLGGGTPIFLSGNSSTLFFRSLSAGTNVSFSINNNVITINANTGTTGTVNGVTGITNVGGGSQVLSAITPSNTLVSRTLSGAGNVNVSTVDNVILISGSALGGGISTGSTLGGGTPIFLSGDSSTLFFRSLSAGTNVNFSINNNVVTINANTGTTGTVNGVTGITSVGGGSEILSAITPSNTLVSRTLSGAGNVNVSTVGNVVLISGSSSSGGGISTGSTLGGGTPIFLSGDSSTLFFRSISGSGIIDVSTVGDVVLVRGFKGENFRVLKCNGTETENGSELFAAYTEATSATPNGNSLGINNRFTILIPPSIIDTTSTFQMDTPYVDIASMTSECDVVFKQDFWIRTDNVNATGIDCFTENKVVIVSDSLPNIIVTRCKGGDFSFADNGGTSNALQGTFIECIGGERSFGGNGGTITDGTFTNCTGGNDSFGGGGGTITDGTFTNCTGGNDSFGGGGGIITNGTFIECIGGDRSFGGSGTITDGTFTNCTGGNDSFGGGGGTSGGLYEYCIGGEDSWNNDTTNGRLYYCRIEGGGSTFNTSGDLVLCIDANDNIVASISGGTSITGITTGNTLGGGTPIFLSGDSSTLYFRSLSAGTNVNFSINNNVVTINANTGTTGTVNGVTGITNVGGGSEILSAITPSNTLVSRTLSGAGNVNVSTVGNVVLISGSSSSGGGISTGSTLGGGTPIFLSGDSSTLFFRSLSAGTNVSFSINNNVITINANTGTTGTVNGVTGITSVGGGSEILSAITPSNTLVSRTLSGAGNVNVSTVGNVVLISGSSSSGGGISTGSTLGAGTPIFLSGDSSTLYFRSLSAGTNVNFSINNNVVTINSTASGGGGGGITGVTSIGNGLPIFSGISNNNIQLLSISGENGIVVTTGTTGIRVRLPIVNSNRLYGNDNSNNVINTFIHFDNTNESIGLGITPSISTQLLFKQHSATQSAYRFSQSNTILTSPVDGDVWYRDTLKFRKGTTTTDFIFKDNNNSLTGSTLSYLEVDSNGSLIRNNITPNALGIFSQYTLRTVTATTASTLLGTVLGTNIISPNYFTQGKTLVHKSRGILNLNTGSDQLTYILRFASTATTKDIVISGISHVGGTTNGKYKCEIDIVCSSVTGNMAFIVGGEFSSYNSGLPIYKPLVPQVMTGFPLNTDQITISILANFNNANADNNITSYINYLHYIN